MYLLDTNVISELRKVKSGKADKHIESWSFQVDPQLLYVSSIVIHEIELGILLAERSDRDFNLDGLKVFNPWESN